MHGRPGSGASTPVFGSREKSRMESRPGDDAYTLRPSGLTTTQRRPARFGECTRHSPGLALSSMHAPAPGSWVRAPFDGLRENSAIVPPMIDATYALRPSGLSAIVFAPLRPIAVSGHGDGAGLLPGCWMQPWLLGSWVSAPVPASREKIVIAPPLAFAPGS